MQTQCPLIPQASTAGLIAHPAKDFPQKSSSKTELSASSALSKHSALPSPMEHLEKVVSFTPTLVLVYVITPGQSVSRTALCDFRKKTLEDDVFQPEFCHNLVFYGAAETDVRIESDAMDELRTWNTETQTFIIGRPGAKVAPGPYVFVDNKVWQPWRIYYDFNGCFMTSFKPSPKNPEE